MPVTFHERVLDVGQLPHFIFMLDLDLRDRGVATGTPVDDPVAPIDQPFVVEADEHLADRVGQTLVEREALPGPVG